MNSSTKTLANDMLLEKPPFIGLDTQYQTADGKRLTRLHLDGAASPLACQVAMDTVNQLLPHYSNSHSYVHSSAQISTKAMAWAHQQMLQFVYADPEVYTAVFMGAGTTAAINRVARGLSAARPDKKAVLVSAMEHHANDLPHRQFDNQVSYIPLTGEASRLGAVDLLALEELLLKQDGKVNYLAVSSVSNVTGIRNPIDKIAALAHQHGALLLVDGAQSVAHGETRLNELDADFFIFSGHKVYTPGSPGVMVAKTALLRELGGQDLGGGSVSTVSYYDYQLLNSYPDKEQSGTPNIVGAVALASVLQTLSELPKNSLEQHDSEIIDYLSTELDALPNVTIYGDKTLKRTGALAFNHADIDHGLLAAILNDYYAIAVRNECFCAHPYVSSLLKEELWEVDLSEVEEQDQENYINRKRGMVRASVSLYNSKDDVDRLISGLMEISERIDELRRLYSPQDDGSYVHNTFKLDWQAALPFIRN